MPDERELSHVLRWETAPASTIEAVRTSRVRSTASALVARLATLPPPLARRAHEVVDTMSNEVLQRLLLSPVVFELAGVHSPRAAIRLAELLEIEAQLAAGECPPVPGWTALGDRWVGPETEMPGPPAIRGPVACRLPVDLSLPELLVNPTAGLRATQPLDEDGLARAARIVDDALRSLQERSDVAHTLVRTFTGNVVLRTEATGRRKVRGASSPAAIGRTVLVNITEADSVTSVVETLVHEAIHQFLSSHELTSPFVREDEARPACSPWTGDVLPLRALVHACFVWWGLFTLRYHHPPPDGNGVGTDDLRDGFRNLDISELKQLGVTPACLAAVDQARQEVLQG